VSAPLRGAQRASAIPTGTPLSPGGERRQFDRIQAQRRGILERLALLEGDTARRAPGVAGTHDEALQLRASLLRCLSALDDAEARILDGLYGRCEACGRWIPPRQLELEPTATRCAPCAASGLATTPSVRGRRRESGRRPEP
jgi:RNA polymerase-binding transcription factor DksA